MIAMRKTKRRRNEKARMTRKLREDIIATVTAVGREKDDGYTQSSTVNSQAYIL